MKIKCTRTELNELTNYKIAREGIKDRNKKALVHAIMIEAWQESKQKKISEKLTEIELKELDDEMWLYVYGLPRTVDPFK